MTKWDHLWINARLATMREGGAPYGAVENAAFADKAGRIVYAGPMEKLPGEPSALATRVMDAKNQWITPGLVDCHTHLVFAGNRAAEFEQRLKGVSYEEIARKGGGIMSTVRATRAASDDELFEQARERFHKMLAQGATTIEVKSGYGLDAETEMRMLRVAKKLGAATGVRVMTTFLGLHTLPPEYASKRNDYIDLMSGPVLRAMLDEGLVDAVDAYCENIAFSAEETKRFFTAAAAAGVRCKLHADQLSDTNGAALAAKFRALSADHLEYTDDAGIAAMAKAGTVAVLLPGAFFILRERKLPPIEALRRHKVPIALATDCNPGTSPIPSLPTIMAMACTLFHMTPEEVLAGVTRNGARALGLGGETGTLEVGKAADYVVWPIEHPSELSYWMGAGVAPAAIACSTALAAANVQPAS
jgi:imidazolonepropionase